RDAAALRGGPGSPGRRRGLGVLCCAAKPPEAAPDLARRNPRGCRVGCLVDRVPHWTIAVLECAMAEKGRRRLLSTDASPPSHRSWSRFARLRGDLRQHEAFADGV